MHSGERGATRLPLLVGASEMDLRREADGLFRRIYTAGACKEVSPLTNTAGACKDGAIKKGS